MSKEITLTIDGQPVSVPAGSTILDAAKKLEIEIPTLCHDERLPPFTSCFLCVVELAGRPNPVPSCSTVALEGMVITTRSDNIRAIRKMCLELLLSDHCGDCIAPCVVTCPAGCNAEKFIKLIADGRNDEAIRVIKEALPIPGALGRVCPRPCESKCRRTRVEEPLTIGWLHRFAADADSGNPYTPPVGNDTGKRVAIVGAGPAGMAAAYFLRQKGHAVTVFEAEPKAGGMLAWGIPAYRLPREELEREMQAIAGMGVEMRFGQKLGTDFSIADLRKEGFNAIFLAVGAPLSASLRTEGEDLPGVMGGIELLSRAAHGEKVPVGDKVIVVGGGNTAIDAARTALRLGAKDVTLLYRRTCAEMPALPIEREEAQREGVQFKFLAAPLAVTRPGQCLCMSCQQMKLGEPDESGRCRPVPVEGAVFEVEADTVVAAIGQVIDSKLIKGEGVELDKRGKAIVVNPRTMQTSIPDVFAGGDAVAREDQKIAVWAVGSGRLASISIDQFLNNHPVTGRPAEFNSTMGESPDEVTAARFAGIEKAARAAMPELKPEARADNFDEVELGLAADAARAEAKRCLECGCKAVEDCKLRKYALEYGADPERFAGGIRDYTIDKSIAGVLLEQGKCVNCGICVRLGADDANAGLFGFTDRGFTTRIKPYNELFSPADADKLAAICAEACPTGAIAARTAGK